jgi:hypothetical protein
MQHQVIDKILARWVKSQDISLEKAKQLHAAISSALSPGQISQFLTSVFQLQTQKITPSELFANWPSHTLSQPANHCPLALRKAELALLTQAKSEGFEPVELSPVAPLGVSSVYKKVHQNRILSALKVSEVVSDPSNMLGLILTENWKKHRNLNATHLATVHRCLRPTAENKPLHQPHFLLFALAAFIPSKDPQLLVASLFQQVQFHLNLCGPAQIRLSFQAYPGDPRLFSELKTRLKIENLPCELREISPPCEGTYYTGCRVLIDVKINHEWVNMSDLGIVTWPAELSGQGHLRLVISGMGVERYIASKDQLL